MNKLNDEKKTTAVAMLCEGNSIRSVERMTGIHRGVNSISAPPRRAESCPLDVGRH